MLPESSIVNSRFGSTVVGVESASGAVARSSRAAWALVAVNWAAKAAMIKLLSIDLGVVLRVGDVFMKVSSCG
jgi:hypothetical protein